MDQFALVFLILVSVSLFVNGLVRRYDYLKFPFLVSTVMIGWFLPQALNLLDDPMLPQNSYAITMIYVSLCLIALFFGWRHKERLTSEYKNTKYSQFKILIYAAILSLIGLASYSLIFRIENPYNSQGLSTGIVTVLFFFSQLKYFGLAIALAVFLRKFSWFALVIIVIDLNAISGFLIFGGRRGPAIFVLLMIAVLLYFRKGIAIPRAALLAGFVAMTVFVNGVATYRSFVQETGRPPSVGEMLDAGITEGTLNNEENFEITNAITYISAANETMRFSHIKEYWNFFVFSYIPGQFIGHSNKQALMFETEDLAVISYGYRRHIGTTYTGFADSFTAFWFFGLFIFYLISRIMRRLWVMSVRDDMGAQIMYASTLSIALHGITHSTMWFFVFFVQAAIFILPGLYWAKIHAPPTKNRLRLAMRRQLSPSVPKSLK